MIRMAIAGEMEVPSYKSISDITPKKFRQRVLAGLKRLRAQLDMEMPQKTRDKTLILGTWNIRNFDDDIFLNGHRTAEDLHYLAEIISRFDIIAIQEICNDTRPLERLIQFLGPNYNYIITDITEGRGGNGERLGFIYDQNKVTFKGVSGELVLPERMQIVSGEKRRQFSRTPFMCSFQAGWFKFLFSTVHIYFGKPSGEKYEMRIKEIDKVARFLADRARKDDQNHILVGDFNIVEPGSPGFNALQKHGFKVYQNKEGSNKDQTKFYDQISFRVRKDELQFSESENCTGVLQFFDSIYREDDFEAYKKDLHKTIREKITKLEAGIVEATHKLLLTASENTRNRLNKSINSKKNNIVNWQEYLQNDIRLKKYYLNVWRTFHGSDHLPLWVELDVDFSDEYLQHLGTL